MTVPVAPSVIDVDTPKSEHIAFLDSAIAPILAGKTARAWLQGSASSSGSDAHNLALSRRRAEKVAEHLKSRGVLASQLQIDAAGESLANARAGESSEDRAVAILAAPLFTPIQPPPRPPAPRPITATRFRLRMLGGLSGGLGPVAIDQSSPEPRGSRRAARRRSPSTSST